MTMGLMARICAIFLTLVGAFGVLVTAWTLDNGWELPIYLVLASGTAVFLVPGLLLCWRAFSRPSLFDFLSALVGGGSVFMLFLQFSGIRERQVRFFHQEPPTSSLILMALLLSCAMFVALSIGQRTIAKLQWQPISGLAMLACAIASALAIIATWSVVNGSDALGAASEISAILVLPMLCVLAMSWTLRLRQRASSR